MGRSHWPRSVRRSLPSPKGAHRGSPTRHPGAATALQVPPRGLWKRSGGVVYAYADRYLAEEFVSADVEELVLRYLAAYGPATAADMTKWSLVTRLGPVLTAMRREGRLVVPTDEKGRTLYDASRAELADPDLPLPVLLLGMYDNVFLSHADRDRIAPEAARKAWMGVNGGVGSTMFLDGLLAGLWRVENGRVVVEPFGRPTKEQRHGIDAEIERVQAFLATPAAGGRGGRAATSSNPVSGLRTCHQVS